MSMTDPIADFLARIRNGILARHADVLSEEEGGLLVLDLRRFHELVPTERTLDFPYPEPAAPPPVS